jgi:hypothetical protein
MLTKLLLIIVLWTVTLVVGALVGAIPLWLLWNWLAPDLFDLPAITLLQAIGLSLLVGLLFGDRLSVSMGPQQH